MSSSFGSSRGSAIWPETAAARPGSTAGTTSSPAPWRVTGSPCCLAHARRSMQGTASTRHSVGSPSTRSLAPRFPSGSMRRPRQASAPQQCATRSSSCGWGGTGCGGWPADDKPRRLCAPPKRALVRRDARLVRRRGRPGPVPHARSGARSQRRDALAVHVLVHLAAWSGLRAAEIAGLQVGDRR